MLSPFRFWALAMLMTAIASAAEPSPALPASPPTATPSTGADRSVTVGDHLRYQVVEDRDPPVEVVVSNTGMIDVPYLGPIQAAGLSLEDLRSKVATELTKELYVHATVRLQVLAFSQGAVNRGRVHLSGQIRRVGPFEIDISERPTLGQTILAAGGLADFGDPRNVRIIRREGGETRTIVVDLREVLNKGHIEKDVELRDGDFIIVSERTINW